MNGLFLHTGNRLEALAAEWAAVTAQPLSSPFAREVVLVQSLGMRRWLSLQLAGRQGVCMNTEFPFPRVFLDVTLRRLVPDMAPADSFAPDTLTWKLHRILPTLLHRPEFTAVRSYMEDGDGLKRYQLATRLAGLFDQYLVYRPQMLLDWERGEAGDQQKEGMEDGAAWQAALWSELNRQKAVHFAAAVERLRQGRIVESSGLPERVSLFGITSLPPAQADVFFALAAHCPVHLFLLAPSREYHGDDLTPKQRARRGLKPGGGGHPLLTSLGKLHAEFTNVLLDADERAGFRIVDTPEHFEEPPEGTLLHGLQRDILHAQSRGEAAAAPAEEALQPLEIAPDDASLEIHVCPSPLREVEALYDRLLALLAEDPLLRPRDILVMMPEIERYAPLIHAVFGSPEDPALRIPYSIADRQPRSDSPAIQTFLSLLETAGTRCTAPEGFALLQSPVFRARFGFDDAELARLRDWIAESGIRWGIDGMHRAQLGLPAFEETTWRHGIERLLLGYAMPGGGRTLFEGILPEDNVEGSEAELLGRFAEAMEAVFSSLQRLEEPRPLGEWPEALRTVIDQFFAPGDEGMLEDVRTLRNAVERLARVAAEAGPEQMVEFAAVREHFAGMLGEAEQRGGFLTGGVTFCALKPMRSIPARVIWLAGMNDGVFPRRPQPPPFDLIHAHPQKGDRSTRDDDRFLFLEALLSARDRLRISYVGRSPSGQETLPPSVMVSELLDHLQASCQFPGGIGAREALVFTHRLHAFSRSYFEPGSRLFSYSAANCAAAARKTARAVPFLERSLEPPEPGRRAVALADLSAFFANPAAFFLRERLGIRLEEWDETLEETEPLAPDALQLYRVSSELFAAQAADAPPPPEAALVARGLLPPGSVGMQHYRSRETAAQTLHAALARLLGTTRPDAPRLLDVRVGSFTLTGRLDALYAGRLAFFRPAKLKAKDRIQAWCAHLAWCAACGETPPPPTVLAGTDAAIQFAPQPPERLLELLELFWQGLQAPLPFFPSTSLTFAENQEAKGKPTLERARAVWRGNVRTRGECENPGFGLCFGGEEAGGDPLDATFETLALAVFGPLLHAESPAV